MKEIFKKKTKLMIAFGIVIVAVLALCIVYESIFSNNSGKYGNRLEGIEKVNIKTKQKNEIKKNIESLEMSSSVKVFLTGKILKVVVVVKDDTDLAKGKLTFDKVIEKLSDDQKKYFDLEIYLSKKGKDDNFPTIGYKNHNKEYISWTKGR